MTFLIEQRNVALFLLTGVWGPVFWRAFGATAPAGVGRAHHFFVLGFF
jgi:hypothetical protein